jgi:hypothetical protein
MLILREAETSFVPRLAALEDDSYLKGKEAITNLRSLSAELIAFGDAEWLADCVLRWMGFQGTAAGRSLSEFTRLSIEPETHQKAVAKALKLPTE